MQHRQPQAALELMMKGVTADPQNGKMHNLLGELALDQGDAQLAEVAFRESIRLGTATPSTYRNLAEALYRRGRMSEALSQLKIALTGAPGRPDIYEGIDRVAVAIDDKRMTDWAAERLAGIDSESWRRLQQVVEAAPAEKNQGKINKQRSRSQPALNSQPPQHNRPLRTGRR